MGRAWRSHPRRKQDHLVGDGAGVGDVFLIVDIRLAVHPQPRQVPRTRGYRVRSLTAGCRYSSCDRDPHEVLP
jgi:hypothetical protein